MATGKALNGKPYAGNPRVAPLQCYGATSRFDEEEVAPAATPRRRSLLYKKQIVLACAACVVAVAIAQSQEQRKISSQYSCILNVKQGFGRGKKETTWATYYGSHDKTQSKSLKYMVDVKWNMKTDADLSIEVIYMASSGQRAVPYSSESLDFSIEGGAKTNFVFESPVLSFRDEKYVYAGERRQRGYKMKGAIIRLKQGDDIIRTYASQPFWGKMAWEREIKVEVEKSDTDMANSFESYEARQKAIEVRLSSQERPPATPPQTNVSPQFFKAQRDTMPAKFKAQMRLATSFYSDFNVFRDTHYCLQISAIDNSNYRTYIYGYVRKASPVGQRIANDFKHGGERDGTVTLRYPRNAKSDDGCFLDDYTIDE